MMIYDVNICLYKSIIESINDIELFTIINDSEFDVSPSQYPRLEESTIISVDTIKSNRSVVVAHNLNEYKNNSFKLDKLIQDSNVIPIDILLGLYKEVRGVSI